MKKIFRILFFPILFVLFWILSSVYTKIRDYYGLDSNEEIVKELSFKIKYNHKDFEAINNYLLNTQTYSTDYTLTDYSRRGIQFQSYTDLDSSGLTFEKYRQLYYKGIDSSTSPCYVPDFELDKSKILSFTRKFNIGYIHVKKTCNNQRMVTYTLRGEYYPSDRIISLRYYPNSICDSIINSIQNIKGYEWIYKVDSNWIIRSRKEYYSCQQHPYVMLGFVQVANANFHQ